MALLGRQQADLYAAETEALEGLGLAWRRLPAAQAYLDALIGSAWFFDHWPTLVRVTIERRGRGSVWSTCQHLDAHGPHNRATEGVILVAEGSLTQAVVLHELAHLLLPAGAGHGPAFARTMLRLVRHEMGFFAFSALHEALRHTESFRAVDFADVG